ncbi:hypothetical protein NL676_007224 [Syzygium grande]|nr:hypothetical protein NL676_007224 [Syzygium grande]
MAQRSLFTSCVGLDITKEAVESWIVPNVRTFNYEGKTHWDRFVENHKELLEKGEKWVKDTANSCMLVSTLIATVLFAAAFTVPGGNDGNTGVPWLLGQDSFLVFAISDALGFVLLCDGHLAIPRPLNVTI